ncbi:hypothetical protein AB5J62_29140 [Amycolatopsis sp. cg5]|uniref:hypothetical protein n=1 Tax=Amycolatopsis sp. cg5 TaxID=3238802 RepID=UPI003524C79E
MTEEEKASARLQWWRDQILPRTVSARQRAFVLDRIARWQTSWADAVNGCDGRFVPHWCAQVAQLIAATDRALLSGEIWQAPVVEVTSFTGVPRLLTLLAVEPDVLHRAELVRNLGMAIGPEVLAQPVAGELGSPTTARFTLKLAMSLYRAGGMSREAAWRMTFDPGGRA